MIWAGSVDQTITEPFKVDEGVKVNRTNYYDFIAKTFFGWYKSQFQSEGCIYAQQCSFACIKA